MKSKDLFAPNLYFILTRRFASRSLKVSCFVLPGVNNIGDEEGTAPFMGEGMERLDNERSRMFPRLRQAFNDYAER